MFLQFLVHEDVKSTQRILVVQIVKQHNRVFEERLTLKDKRSGKTKEFDFSSCGLGFKDEINTKKGIKIGTRKLLIVAIRHKTIEMFNITIKSEFHLLTLLFFTKKFLLL